MAPELGFSTYKRYKSGTREFTSWLAQTAKSLSADVLPTIPLAGKKGINGGRKRKAKNKNENGNSVKANSHGDYEIQIADFLPLAQLIADYEVPVPDHIYNLLGNVIMLRKEASAWLRSSEGQESHPAIGENHDHDNDHDHGHKHFISVISHVKNILRKCVGSKIHEKQKDIFDEVQKSTTNMFEKIGVEETKTEPDQPVKTPITTVSTVTAVQTQGAKFDIAGHDEVLFACIFFFQDFHSTRLLLREAWKDYRDGEDSLMAVSLITNTAIELIQRAVTELLTEINGRHEHAPTERKSDTLGLLPCGYERG
ncbi:hypothetical protein HYALB_00012899 [Hymenoscyphus albidus]|uniref:DUF6604 domain-containing protein n=1 Tax=Hymenoscyphus albidus TaxID=595503 RepID=A0A9N9PYA7_9HELO|nr:hypothetical protein HYALB_00012899 [Hymenoscyphus albidus]